MWAGVVGSVRAGEVRRVAIDLAFAARPLRVLGLDTDPTLCFCHREAGVRRFTVSARANTVMNTSLNMKTQIESTTSSHEHIDHHPDSNPDENDNRHDAQSLDQRPDTRSTSHS